jgi:mono/diheme cytochrome c family protein
LPLRLHINDSDFSTPVNFPRAVAVTPDGRRAFLVLAGSDAVMGIDLSSSEKPKLLGFWPTGKHPRGIVLDREGIRAYVMNYLSRDVSVLEVADTVRRRELARIPVVGETLDAEMIRGKILFNNASDPRLSHLGWISCASCHPDGGADNTTWITPEGHRQTMPLWDLGGTAPFHISTTRDELQDFEHDIEELMRGIGLAPGAAKSLLGEPNAGTSADLDALARFVLEGIRVPRAFKADQTAIERGREVFQRAGCAACHGGPQWTLSNLPGPPGTLAANGELEVEAALRDVGTYNPETDVLGEKGFDIPTLLGLHATAPYLHDGSAATLEDLLGNEEHVGALLGRQEQAALVVFLRSIDSATPPFEPEP